MSIIVGDEPGNVENRRQDRITASFSVTFREIGDEAAELLSELKSGGVLPEASSATDKVNALSENISIGGISFTGDLQLLGDRKLEKGTKLLVDFLLPGEASPLSAVAVVAWSIEGRGEHGKFTAGLMFMGIEAADLDKIQRYVQGQNKS